MISDTDTERAAAHALSTKLEEEFISPLTAVRGVLEILRDFPQLSHSEKQQFIHNALTECTRLETGIEHLARTVYTDTELSDLPLRGSETKSKHKQFGSRVHLLKEFSVIEIDFSDFEFSSSKLVNEFYDELEATIIESGKSWYFMVNYTNCSIWPQAWVAFAHRGKKINVGFSLGTVRFTQQQSPDEMNHEGQPQNPHSDSDMFNSRELALSYLKNCS